MMWSPGKFRAATESVSREAVCPATRNTAVTHSVASALVSAVGGGGLRLAIANKQAAARMMMVSQIQPGLMSALAAIAMSAAIAMTTRALVVRTVKNNG